MRSLRSQLISSHLILVLLIGFVMSGATVTFFSLTQSVNRVLQGNFRTILAAQEMNASLQEQETAFALLTAGDVQEGKATYQRASRDFEIAFKTARLTSNTPDELACISRISSANDLAKNHATQIFRDLAIKNRSLLSSEFTASLRPELQKMRQLSQKLLTVSRLAILVDNQKARDGAQIAFWKSVGITIASMIFAGVIAVTMIRRILTPLAALARQADRIAAGDLSQHRIKPRSDEIGELADRFNAMAAQLAEVRKSEVRKMQRLEKISEAAISSLYDPLIITDAQGRIIRLNKAAETLFGPVPDSPRKPASEHISDRRIVHAIRDVLNQQEVSAKEDESALVQISVGSDHKTYRLRSSPMHGEEGNLVGSVTVLEDITYLKVLDQMKNEFIGVASHELRTPVTSLILSVQLLLEGAAGPLTPAQSQVISAQSQDLDRLEKLMRDLLDVTKLEAGMSKPKLEVVEAGELMLYPIKTLKPQAEQKGIQLLMTPPAEKWFVHADRVQIGRVLTNLIVNAIRHTPTGGSVNVRAEATLNDVTFTVEDTGEGIPEEYQSRIFERFVQVPGATQGGAGLGLAIANGIVKSHGGEMSVTSQVGKGSCFSFKLPLLSQDAE